MPEMAQAEKYRTAVHSFIHLFIQSIISPRYLCGKQPFYSQIDHNQCSGSKENALDVDMITF